MRGLRLHVLIDSLTRGGAEGLLSDFALGAQDAGIEVSVAHFHGQAEGAARLRALGIEPERVPIKSLLGRADRRAVREHLAAVAPDLLHTHLGYADLLGGLGARALGIPSVSTIHIEDWTGHFRGDRVKYHLMGLARRRCAARVIAVSEAARRSYLRQHWDRPRRVVTVANGIVDRPTPGSGAGVRKSLGIGADEHVVAMVGVLRPEKRHDIAIAAVEQLIPRFPRLRLLIVGEGTERPAIEQRCSHLGSRVLMTGYREDVPELLDAADVLAQPSSTEAFPTSLLEAMASRVPSVATAVGGIPEIVLDGETGLLIPAPPAADALAAALARLISDPALRGRLADRGRERFEANFTVDRWLARLLPVYEIALSEAG
jgi:glycosyltransferase involved in cell wall biosynthesis